MLLELPLLPQAVWQTQNHRAVVASQKQALSTDIRLRRFVLYLDNIDQFDLQIPEQPALQHQKPKHLHTVYSYTDTEAHIALPSVE